MFVILEEDGRPAGWLPPNDPNMPEGALEVSDAIYQECMANPGRRRIVVSDGVATVKPYAPPVADIAAAKLAEINAACDAEVAALAVTYPETEVLSWHRQEREARELQANPAAATPLIDNIADQRGITREDLAGRIIAKAHAYALEAGTAFGRRQALEDQIEAIKARLQAGGIDEEQARAEVSALSYLAT